MAKQSQRIGSVLVAVVVLCLSMMAVQVNAARPGPARYLRGYEPALAPTAPSYGAPEYAPSNAPTWAPAYAPEYATPQGSPMAAPVVASPADAPSSGSSPAYAPGPMSG